MRWYVPFNSLSLKQRQVLDGISRQSGQTHWVQGFAGTGKTLVLTHLIERVAAENPQASLCFITFTHALKDLMATGFHGPVARRVKIQTHTQFLRNGNPYDFVFLDEVQDIKPLDLRRIKSLAGELYVAGDPDQRIYAEGAQEAEIEDAVEPVTWKLLEIFRLTKLLRQLAIAILPKAQLVEGNDALNTANVTIKLLPFDDPEEEVAWVWSEALKRSRPGDPSVILCPTHNAVGAFARRLAEDLGVDAPDSVRTERGKGRDYDPFNEHWAEHDVPLVYLGSGYGSLPASDTRPLVYLMTFHSAKGLDFKNVFIPGLTASAVIVHSDALVDDPDLARRLLFVAVTRSRENLFISYHGSRPHPYLANLPKHAITEAKPTRKAIDDEEDFF